MNYAEIVSVLASTGTLILIIIGLSKFLAGLSKNKEDIRSLKVDLEKINSRLINIENENIRLSSYLDYYFKEKWRKKDDIR